MSFLYYLYCNLTFFFLDYNKIHKKQKYSALDIAES